MSYIVFGHIDLSVSKKPSGSRVNERNVTDNLIIHIFFRTSEGPVYQFGC